MRRGLRPRWWLAAAPLLSALALAGPASATTYCVNAGGCSGTSESTLQTALTAAATTGSGPDTVVVGDPGTPPSTGYAYNPTDGAVNPVEIVGSGAGTVLTAGNTGQVVLNLGSNSHSSVRDLTLSIHSPGTGLVASGTARNISVTGSSNSDAGVVSVPPVDASPIAGALLGSSVSVSGGTGLFIAPANGQYRAEDDSVSAGLCLIANRTDPVVVHRVRLGCSSFGVLAQEANGSVSIDDSTIRATGSSSWQGIFAEPSSAGTASVDANHVTIYGNAGQFSSFGVNVQLSADNETETLTLRNSIVRNVSFTAGRAANGGGGSGVTRRANIDFSYSDADPIHLDDQTNDAHAGGAITFSTGDIDENPHFIDPASGNFAVPAGSPVVDAGDPAGLSSTESPTDVLGNARISGPRRDMGAVEYQYPAPAPAVPAGPAPPVLPPVLSGLRESAKKWRMPKAPTVATIARKKPPVGTTFSFGLDKPAPVNLSFKQLKSGRKVGRRCVTPTKRNKHKRRCTRRIAAGALTLPGHAGPNKVHFLGRVSASRLLKPGKYSVAISAGTGVLSSAPQTLTFTIVK